ncbi:biotin--[acetyl-CoA-carboxylase] ligase [uncultured Methanobrevibacter sp.]|uniref:biotin--[acetyl-CoA-carboxylase] ligase n=1 Tax=uncultured Methanobrevibacter sp. TaxID=253161 RepID=UPI002601A7A3|nr:biotin--[acetyl-CoA-carboxylase] ligase [uncultured Methanobrevibacter sp.]
MQNEIIKLLKKEEKLSEETIAELSNIEISDFSDSVKELGKNETAYIKREEILKDLNTTYIGKDMYIFNEVMSTNTIAKFLSMNGVGNGAVVISEKQTKARGRSGKNWESPLGGVWLSIILNPNVTHSKIPLITLATGVAVENTLKRIGIQNAEIKWPNDILINDKKVCGILTEAITSFNTIESVIIGVGIDANITLKDFPEELKEKMTTLNKETGEKIDENLLIKTFLEEFEKISKQFMNEEYENILKEWRKHSYTIGKIVEVHEPFSKPYDGYVLGISRDGSLVVEKIDGTLEKVISGECVIKN